MTPILSEQADERKTDVIFSVLCGQVTSRSFGFGTIVCEQTATTERTVSLDRVVCFQKILWFWSNTSLPTDEVVFKTTIRLPHQHE